MGQWNLCARAIAFVWFAPLCRSFSVLRFLDRSGPLRPHGPDGPAGDEGNPEVRKGNLLWRRTLELAAVCHGRGIPFAIEHPASSLAWKMSETLEFIKLTGSFTVHVDQCRFGVGPDRIKKPTTLLTTCEWLAGQDVRCDHQHYHVHARGSKARAAAAYPREWCRHMARLYLTSRDP